LHPGAPFRLDLTVWALRRRPDNALDRWDDNTTYKRVVTAPAGLVDVAVSQKGTADAPALQVTLNGPAAQRASTRRYVTEALNRTLGLMVDLSDFYRGAQHDPLLDPLVDRFRGLRPPQFLTPIEAMASAVSCQQLSLTVGIRLLNRLCDMYGGAGPSGAHSFPEAEDLAATSGEELRKLGYSTRKGHVLAALAHQIASGQLDFEDLAKHDDDALRSRLCELDGIGRWSAEYIMLRGFGRLDVFPGDDVGARNRLRRWVSTPEPLDYPSLQRIVGRWKPYAGLTYFHLLLDGLAESGLLTGDSPSDAASSVR
jgi:DNA-3-methyladenine glycosylase II